MLGVSCAAFIFLLSWEIPYIRCTSNDIAIEDNEQVLLRINKISNFKLNITNVGCNNIGICDDVHNYPETRINEIIRELHNKIYYEDSVINDNNDFRSQPLCRYNTKSFTPQAVRTKTGKWYLVVNTKESPVQRFTGKECERPGGTCLAIVVQPESTCKQIYFERPMVVLNTAMDKVVRKLLPVPCCCKCHMRIDDQEEAKTGVCHTQSANCQ